MITVIPRKIAATSVNGVAVANDGSITLPVDNAPTSGSTNFVTSDGVKTELDTLSERIPQIQVDVPFSIPISDWNLNNEEEYTATIQNSSITSTCSIFINYDDIDIINASIVATTSQGQLILTTEIVPSDTITGTFCIIESGSGV